jgi:hypothetical protein
VHFDIKECVCIRDTMLTVFDILGSKLKAAAAELGASFAKNGAQQHKKLNGEKQDSAMSRSFGTRTISFC